MNIGSTTVRLLQRALLQCLALIILLFLSKPVIGQVDPATASQSQPEVLWHQASALFPIQVLLPEGFDSTQIYPTVIALHGFGGSSEKFERIGRAFAEAGFIAVLPEAPYPLPYPSDDFDRHSTWELSTWTEEYGLGPPLTDDPAIEAQSASMTTHQFLRSVISRIHEEYRAGPLYMFGFSLGGVYTLAGGFYNRDQIDEIVAFGVDGLSREWFTNDGGSLEDGKNVAVRLVQGRSDPMIPFSHAEQARDVLRKAGYQVTLDGFDGGHAVPDDALKRAVSWVKDLANRQ
jgi:predicted esterase